MISSFLGFATRIAVAIGFATVAVSALAQNYTTERFDVGMELSRDGTLKVVEEIDVTFTKPQRGLIRKLPMITAGNNDTARKVRYELVGVTANRGKGDEEEPTQTKESQGDFAIRIGRQRIFLNGPVRYRIVYQVYGACTPIAKTANEPAHTELFWNVTPTAWATSIDQSKVMIAYPTVELGNLKARILVGGRGSRTGIELAPRKIIGRTDLVSGAITPTFLTFQSVKPLSKGQGMTVILSLPAKTIVAPAPEIVSQASLRGIPWNWSYFFAPFLILIPVALWKRSQRHEVGPLVVQFDPPEGFGPTECGMIEDRRLDPRDFVGGIISLAQKGAAKIHAESVGQSSFDVILLSLDQGRDLTDFEERLYRTLEPFGPQITAQTLRGNFGADFRDLASGLEVSLINDGVFVSPRAGSSFVGCLFAFVMLAIAVVLGKLIGPAGMIGTVLTGFIGILILAKRDPWTLKGARLRQHIMGMREFIQRANRDELINMSQTMPLQALYERLLPFAIAFGLVKNWSKAFDGLDLEAPDWFEAPYDPLNAWTFYSFASMIDNDHEWNDSFSSAGSSWNGVVSSFDSGSGFSSGDSGFGGGFDSSSGGFDGGGSSGDGGGGGGGDSW